MLWSTDRVADQNRPTLWALSHGTDEQAIAISPDGTHTAVADAGTIYLSRTGSGETAATQEVLSGGGPVPSGGLRFLGDNTHLVSAAGDSLVLWDTGQLTRIGTGSKVHVPFGCHGCPPPALSVAPNGQWVAIAGNGGQALTVLNTAAGTSKIVNEDVIAEYFGLVGWSADSQTIYVVRGTRFEARAAADPARVLRASPLGANDTVLALSPDAKQMVVEREQQIEVHDIASGETVRTLTRLPSDEEISDRWLSSDNRTVAVRTVAVRADQLEARIFLIQDGKIKDVPGENVLDVGLGDNVLIQRRNGTLEVWGQGADQPARSITQDAGFMPAGNRTKSHPVISRSMIAQRRSDGLVVVTAADSGRQLGAVDLPPGRAAEKTSFAFLPNASELISVTEGDEDGLYTRWTLTPDTWTATACRTAARDITTAEWQQFADTVPRPDHICDLTDTKPEVAAVSATEPVRSAPAPAKQPPLATDMDGRNPAYLTAVDSARHTVTVDRIELKDRAIVNDNPRLRTLGIADPVRVTTVSDGIPTSASIPVTELAGFLAGHPAAGNGRLSTSPYQLQVKNGQVTDMEELRVS